MLVSISDIGIQDWSSGCAKKDKSPKCCTSVCLYTDLSLLNIRLSQPIYSLALVGSGASSQLTHFYLAHIIMLWDMYDFFFRLLWLCCIFAIWKTHVFVRKKRVAFVLSSKGARWQVKTEQLKNGKVAQDGDNVRLWQGVGNLWQECKAHRMNT